MLIRIAALALFLTACATPKVAVVSSPAVVTAITPAETENVPDIKCTTRPCVAVAGLIGEITPQSASDTLKFMAAATVAHADAVVILILSPGGHLGASQIIFGAIKSAPMPTYCYVGAVASSGAFWALQGCAERVAEPKAHLMVHEGYIHVTDASLHIADLIRIANELEAANRVMIADIAPRLLMTPDALESKLKLGDWEMDAADALNAGAIDKIVSDDAEAYIESVKVGLKKQK